MAAPAMSESIAEATIPLFELRRTDMPELPELPKLVPLGALAPEEVASSVGVVVPDGVLLTVTPKPVVVPPLL